MIRPASLLFALAFASALLIGCQRRPSPTSGGGDESGSTQTDTTGASGDRAQASRRPPAGATCSGRDDCTSDQVCVEGRCRYRATSVSGEILAAAAHAQGATGDWGGAIETYQASFARFHEQDAPIPPSVVCAAAELTLRSASDPEGRERGARQADLCFRTTVPAHPARQGVMQALARLRYEGLDISLFDAEEPAERFFTQDPSRPTVDVVETEIEMPELEPPKRSHAAVSERLESEDGRRTIAECFVQDWENRHESSAMAELVIRHTTRLQDMGSYDVYVPQIEIEGSTGAEEGFEHCLAQGLPGLFDPNARGARGEPWSQAVRFHARIQ